MATFGFFFGVTQRERRDDIEYIEYREHSVMGDDGTKLVYNKRMKKFDIQ